MAQIRQQRGHTWPPCLPLDGARYGSVHIAERTYSRSFGGLGLGLAIVRQLVELHSGTVWAQSAGKGLGATFVVALPILTAPHGAGVDDQSTIAAARSLEGFRELVVEDEPDSRQLLAALLEQCGGNVTAVTSAKEALARLEMYTPDLIVADVGLPEEDGYALMSQIRARESISPERVPALALTAYTRSEDRARALARLSDAHREALRPARLYRGGRGPCSTSGKQSGYG